MRLGKTFAPVGGADMGSRAKGLGGIAGAVAGGGGMCFMSCSHLHEQSVSSLVAVDGADSGVLSPDSERLLPTAGEFSDMDLRKSMYAVGGLIGVAMGSSLHDIGPAEWGVVADRADEGKVLVTGVASCANLGLHVVAMLTKCDGMPNG